MIKTEITRRDFFKITGALGSTALVALSGCKTGGDLEGDPLIQAGRDISPKTKKERVAIPSACWQCVARDGIIGYVEDGRLVKVEGNPKLKRTNGVLCARGQAGVNQPYDPDRILHPMERVGKRGEGKWKKVSWDHALRKIADKMKALLDAGTPEKVMFHYGRMKASSSKIIKDYFFTAYGTNTIGNHTSICESAKWTAQEMVWGKHYDVNDMENTRFILNFGCNVFETHTNHLPLSQRTIQAAVERKVPLITFDVRLSNTAAKSREWVPIKPGTDLAVVLAMANVVMSEGLYDKDFIENWTNVTVQELKDHLKQYTPQWAEGISGVSASKIKSLALEYARTKPSTILSYRGAVMHYNGIQAERAIMMLEAIVGNIDVKGGRCKAVGASWKNSFKKAEGHPKKLKIIDGKDIPFPTHHISHQVFKMIKEGSYGRPEIYIFYCYNPVYVNGECQENIDIMKDENLMPFIVAVDPFCSESTALADLILPDATYLERWDWEDMVSMNQIPEFYIRQPFHKPLGEARDFKDVCCQLARMIGSNVAKGMQFNSAEEFVKDACENTPEIKAIGGFEYMKKHGAWFDEKAAPKYKSYAKEIKADDLKGETILFDEPTGVYWNWKKSGAKDADKAKKKGYMETKDAYKGYIGTKMKDGKVYVGFAPDKLNKDGRFNIKYEPLAKKGFSAIPAWMPIPEHEKMSEDELILTTFKVNVQTHSRTQNCKYLTEIYHDNPGWVNTKTAERFGIKDGDSIRITSSVGSIATKARVTEAIVPDVIAISHHCGHWEYGEIASGKKAATDHTCDSDCKLKWWTDNGIHPNWIIPNSPEPISGAQRWMDTVVTVEKA